jgi:hypothetical protein
MMIKDGDKKNTMGREKYTVELAGVPLFPTFSDINIFEYSQPRFRTIQPNDIIPGCKFTDSLD